MSLQQRDVRIGLYPIGAHGSNSSLSGVVTLTKPAGAGQLLVQALDQNVRFRLDGTNPTASVGFRLTAGDPPILIAVAGADVRVIEETATATLQYQWVA